jgi:hypothetical protein
MTNFTIFNSVDIEALVTPYASGMAQYITPIKYEAITPDIFVFLFRTTGNDRTDHYFVSLEFDYIGGLDEAKKLIEDWHGEVIEFLQPEIEIEENDPRIKINETYQALLAEVVPPSGTGYWATNIAIYSKAEAEGVITNMPERYQANVRKGVEGIFKDYPDAAISVLLNEDGTTEYFFK